MENLKISTYLENFDKAMGSGTCKSCSVRVVWGRERVAAHKRSSCVSATAEEKRFFAKRKSADVSLQSIATNDESNDSTSSANTSMRSGATNAKIGKAVANFYLRTGVAFWNRLEKLVKAIEFPSKVIGKLEADCAPLSLVYHYFWPNVKHYGNDEIIQQKVSVNEMICSSAASERVWSIYRFIHTRLRNRLSNDKVDKLAFVYINSAILDKDDQTDYLLEIGAALSGTDCQNVNKNVV